MIESNTFAVDFHITVYSDHLPKFFDSKEGINSKYILVVRVVREFAVVSLSTALS